MSLKNKEVWIIVQSLDHHKRVRLLDGRLTPAFEYPAQAFSYAKSHGIFHCDIIKIKSEVL